MLAIHPSGRTYEGEPLYYLTYNGDDIGSATVAQLLEMQSVIEKLLQKLKGEYGIR